MIEGWEEGTGLRVAGATLAHDVPILAPGKAFMLPHVIIVGLSAILAGFLTNLVVTSGWSRARRAIFTMLLAAVFIVVGELGWLELRALV